MSDTRSIELLAIAVLAGALLGAFFFGGLWWTIQKGAASETPAFWFLGSLVLRTGVTLAGCFLISQGHWERLIACLAGFTFVRFLVTRPHRARLTATATTATTPTPTGTGEVTLAP